MIAFLRGIIEDKTENSIVLDCNGVGYEVNVSSFTLDDMPAMGQMVKLNTYMQVREDGVSLFGFSRKDEKDVFLKLIEVSGIGPKMAISILSSISVKDFINYVSTGNSKMLSTVKGLGKKTAERVVLELSSSFDTLPLLQEDFGFSVSSKVTDEAVDTLVSMGLMKYEAMKIVKSIAKPDDTTETLIRKALKYMNK